MVAIFNTNVAACMGVLGWTLVDYCRNRRRFSAVGACEGALAGLVGITPAAGYVSPWFAAAIGFITSIACALLHNLNEWLHIDEGMDVFKIHGVGGMIGSLLTGAFASLDGSTLAPGAIDGVWIQLAKQLAEIGAISGYSFVVSCILLYIIKVIPGMTLRVNEEAEMNGLDNHKFFDEQIGDRHIHDAIESALQSTKNSFPGTPRPGTPRSEELTLLKPSYGSEVVALPIQRF